MAYAVIAHYRCDPDDAELVREALLKMRERTLEEPGNLSYVVHADVDVAGGFTLYEQYVGRDAFDAHAASEHFRHYILDSVRPRLAGREVWFGEVL